MKRRMLAVILALLLLAELLPAAVLAAPAEDFFSVTFDGDLSELTPLLYDGSAGRALNVNWAEHGDSFVSAASRAELFEPGAPYYLLLCWQPGGARLFGEGSRFATVDEALEAYAAFAEAYPEYAVYSMDDLEMMRSYVDMGYIDEEDFISTIESLLELVEEPEDEDDEDEDDEDDEPEPVDDDEYDGFRTADEAYAAYEAFLTQHPAAPTFFDIPGSLDELDEYLAYERYLGSEEAIIEAISDILDPFDRYRQQTVHYPSAAAAMQAYAKFCNNSTYQTYITYIPNLYLSSDALSAKPDSFITDYVAYIYTQFGYLLDMGGDDPAGENVIYYLAIPLDASAGYPDVNVSEEDFRSGCSVSVIPFGSGGYGYYSEPGSVRLYANTAEGWIPAAFNPDNAGYDDPMAQDEDGKLYAFLPAGDTRYQSDIGLGQFDSNEKIYVAPGSYRLCYDGLAGEGYHAIVRKDIELTDRGYTFDPNAEDLLSDEYCMLDIDLPMESVDATLYLAELSLQDIPCDSGSSSLASIDFDYETYQLIFPTRSDAVYIPAGNWGEELQLTVAEFLEPIDATVLQSEAAMDDMTVLTVCYTRTEPLSCPGGSGARWSIPSISEEGWAARATLLGSDMKPGSTFEAGDTGYAMLMCDNRGTSCFGVSLVAMNMVSSMVSTVKDAGGSVIGTGYYFFCPFSVPADSQTLSIYTACQNEKYGISFVHTAEAPITVKPSSLTRFTGSFGVSPSDYALLDGITGMSVTCGIRTIPCTYDAATHSFSGAFPMGRAGASHLNFRAGSETFRIAAPLSELLSGSTVTVSEDDLPEAAALRLILSGSSKLHQTVQLTFLNAYGWELGSRSLTAGNDGVFYFSVPAETDMILAVPSLEYGFLETRPAELKLPYEKGMLAEPSVSVSMPGLERFTYLDIRCLGLNEDGSLNQTSSRLEASMYLTLTDEDGQSYYGTWYPTTCQLSTDYIPAGSYTVTLADGYGGCSYLCEPLVLEVPESAPAQIPETLPVLELRPAAVFSVSFETLFGAESFQLDDYTVSYFSADGWKEVPLQQQTFKFALYEASTGLESYQNHFVTEPIPIEDIRTEAGLRIVTGTKAYPANTAYDAGSILVASQTIYTAQLMGKTQVVEQNTDDLLDGEAAYREELTFPTALQRVPSPELRLRPDAYLSEAVPLDVFFLKRAASGEARYEPEYYAGVMTLSSGSNTVQRAQSFPELPYGTYDVLLLPQENGASRAMIYSIANLPAGTEPSVSAEQGECLFTDVTFSESSYSVLKDYHVATGDSAWKLLRFGKPAYTVAENGELTVTVQYEADTDRFGSYDSGFYFSSNETLPWSAAQSVEQLSSTDGKYFGFASGSAGTVSGSLTLTVSLAGSGLKAGDSFDLWLSGYGTYSLARVTVGSGLEANVQELTLTDSFTVSGRTATPELWVSVGGSARRELPLTATGNFHGELNVPEVLVNADVSDAFPVAFYDGSGSNAALLETYTVTYEPDAVQPEQVGLYLYNNGKNAPPTSVVSEVAPDGSFPGLDNYLMVFTPGYEKQIMELRIVFSDEDAQKIISPVAVIDGIYGTEYYEMVPMDNKVLTRADGTQVSFSTTYSAYAYARNYGPFSFEYTVFELPDTPEIADVPTLAETVENAGETVEDLLAELENAPGGKISESWTQTGTVTLSPNGDRELADIYGLGMYEKKDYDFRITTEVTAEVGDWETLLRKYDITFPDDSSDITEEDEIEYEPFFVSADELTEAGADPGDILLARELPPQYALVESASVLGSYDLVLVTGYQVFYDLSAYDDTPQLMGDSSGGQQRSPGKVMVDTISQASNIQGNINDASTFAKEAGYVKNTLEDLADNNAATKVGYGVLDKLGKVIGVGQAVLEDQFEDQANDVDEAIKNLRGSYSFAKYRCRCKGDEGRLAKIEDIYQQGLEKLNRKKKGVEWQETITDGLDIGLTLANAAGPETIAVKIGIGAVKDITNDLINSDRRSFLDAIMRNFANLMADVSTGCDPSECRKPPEPEPFIPSLDRPRPPLVDGKPCHTRKSRIRYSVDPSGIVYEGILSNPLEGVICTIWYSPTGEEGSFEIWDGSEYQNQINPQITANTGAYAWDVPTGFWKISYEKDGYETAWSEVMFVPPERFDVNQAMVPLNASFTASAAAASDGITVSFTKPVPLSELNDSHIALLKDGMPVSASIAAEDAGGGYTASLRFVLAPDSASVYTVRVTALNSTAGTPCSFDTPVDMSALTDDTVCAAVTASPASDRLVAFGDTVTFSTLTEGAEIWYTTDGSCPCVTSNPSRILYTAPIPVTGETHFIAYAVKDGLADSPTKGFTYFVEAPEEPMCAAIAVDDTSVTASLFVDLSGVSESCDIMLICYDSDGRYLDSQREYGVPAAADSVTLAKRFVFDEPLTEEITVKVFVLRNGAWVPLTESGEFRAEK